MNGSKLVKLITILVIAVIGFIIYKSVFTQPRTGYETVMTDMCDAIENGDIEKYESYMTMRDKDFSDSDKSKVKATIYYGMSNMKNTYGDKLDITYHITKSTDMKSTKGQDNVNKFCNLLKFDSTKVSNIYTVKYKYTIKGNKSSKSGSDQCVFLEINNKFYPLLDIVMSGNITT